MPKRSVFTGEQIYNKITRLREEALELEQSLDEVNNGTLPHKILSQHSEDKIRELKQAQNEHYEFSPSEGLFKV